MRNQPNTRLWHPLTEEIMTGMHEWRQQHPKATLREMENELDARWAQGARPHAARYGVAACGDGVEADPRRRASDLSPTLEERGAHARDLQTHGGQTIALERSYGVCPTCQVGLFPRCLANPSRPND